MNQILPNDPFSPQTAAQAAFDEIKVSLASPDRILSWSYGEIKNPETINYRTHKPEREGLFCAKIFGPVKDYECLCGKYKRMKHKGLVCEKCGVEVTQRKVRRERMAHIDLAAPCTHIWFLKSLPSRIGLVLDMTLRDLEHVLYFEKHVVIEPGLTELSYGQLLSEEDLSEMRDLYGFDSFKVGIGAEVIREMLSNVDLKSEAEHLRADLAETSSELKSQRIVKRLKVIEAFIESGNRPEWMVMTVLPVIPPELRPLVGLEGGRFAVADLNDLYRRVINRNKRLRKMIDLNAPDIILRNEKRMLQEAVDALFDNGRRGRAIADAKRRSLKSLTDNLKGKQGRFRQNLLGKRVDFSGRSVIVTGPELKLHQCGLPKKMALELFKPFIYGRLETMGISTTVKQSKKMVEEEHPEVWNLLAEAIRQHPVLLNRAPTLHRLGIQAFEPILVEGKAIQLHPLVCTAFNADFDGDQMAVHVPLSLEAQLEARVLMLATNNVLSPANGAPIIVPSQDMVLGLYYASIMREGMKGEGMAFATPAEVEQALDAGAVHLHAKVHVRLPQTDEKGKEVHERFETTPGRVRIGALLPRNSKAPFSLVNRLLRKREVQQVIDTVYRYCSQKESVIFCDRIMALGFGEACRAGISFGKDDMVVPERKATLIEETREQVKGFEKQYMDGLITQGEKYNKVVDAWSKCNDMVTDAMMSVIAGDEGEARDPNSVYMMAHSGARGSVTQMKQLGGMRGLMAKPSGAIIETPIISNFKEGLTVLEYFNSTHGARKGLTDTALKTANSGYLTRRLVDVAQDCIVREEDCGTKRAIVAEAAVNDGEVVASLAERLLGRIVAENIVDPASGEKLAKAGQMVDERMADAIDASAVQTARIRSPLTCESEDGVCVKCYGRDLARGTVVNVGEAVGIIAAQSIGEPGTQLTMRTFHIGGVAQAGQQSFQEAAQPGKVAFENARTLKNASGDTLVTGRNMILRIMGKDGVEIASHKVGYGFRLLVGEGDEVARGDRLFEWDPYTMPILAEHAGRTKYSDLTQGVSFQEFTDEETGFAQRIVSDWRTASGGGDLKPQILVLDAKGEPVLGESGNPVVHAMSVGAILDVEDGNEIAVGDVVARIPREGTRAKDITGGLPRVAELFEARRPKDNAVIASVDGHVRFERDYKAKRRIAIEPFDESQEPAVYMVPKGIHIPVQDGDRVQKGDYIIDGNPAPHDILSIMGIEALAQYMIKEVQDVYRLQGVKINDKHIEVIVRQMLRKREIVDSGGTTLIKGEHVDAIELKEINERAEATGLAPAKGETILLGITKAALQTRSFISAASFQETTRVLTEASILGKVDSLVGLKENVIVGRLIPAGTGAASSGFEEIAKKRDNMLIEDRKAAAAALEAERLTEMAAEEAVKSKPEASEDDAAETPAEDSEVAKKKAASKK